MVNDVSTYNEPMLGRQKGGGESGIVLGRRSLALHPTTPGPGPSLRYEYEGDQIQGGRRRLWFRQIEAQSQFIRF